MVKRLVTFDHFWHCHYFTVDHLQGFPCRWHCLRLQRGEGSYQVGVHDRDKKKIRTRTLPLKEGFGKREDHPIRLIQANIWSLGQVCARGRESHCRLGERS